MLKNQAFTAKKTKVRGSFSKANKQIEAKKKNFFLEDRSPTLKYCTND